MGNEMFEKHLPLYLAPDFETLEKGVEDNAHLLLFNTK